MNNEDEPIAYKIGDQPFLGLTIYLDSHPLIPRVETEWWVDQMLQSAAVRHLKDVSDGDGRRDSKFLAKNYARPEGGEPLRLLDMCSGSGAIGCAFLKNVPNAQVYFGEIEPAHESTIEKNIRENMLDKSRAHVRIGDLFAPFADMKFDVIACNPPYIPSEREIDASVADYEPALALRSGKDGLDLMRRIAHELPHYLHKGGEAWIECDSGHAEEARALFEHDGLHPQIRTDQYGAPRIIVVSYP